MTGSADVEDWTPDTYRATYSSLEQMLQHYLDTGTMLDKDGQH